jgi:cytochrome c-type biogenesis protein CcmE
MNGRRKWGLLSSVALVLAALGYLVVGNFQGSLVYFYTPSEVLGADDLPLNPKRIRVGGIVEEGSMDITATGSLLVDFRLTDGASSIPVRFEGVPPDLFEEGQGAVVEGHWKADGVFRADLIMAKHAEDYMPRELAREGVQMPRVDPMSTITR